MTNPVPASAAVLGSLVSGGLSSENSLSRARRNSPRLFMSSSTRCEPLPRLIGLRMRISIEYSTFPFALRGASERSVMISFCRLAGSSSPKAVPRSFSYWPAAPKDTPPNVGDCPEHIVGDCDRAQSMAIFVMRASALGAAYSATTSDEARVIPRRAQRDKPRRGLIHCLLWKTLPVLSSFSREGRNGDVHVQATR